MDDICTSTKDCQGCKQQITRGALADTLRLLQTTAHGRLRTYVLYRAVGKPDPLDTLPTP